MHLTDDSVCETQLCDFHIAPAPVWVCFSSRMGDKDSFM